MLKYPALAINKPPVYLSIRTATEVTGTKKTAPKSGRFFYPYQESLFLNDLIAWHRFTQDQIDGVSTIGINNDIRSIL